MSNSVTSEGATSAIDVDIVLISNSSSEQSRLVTKNCITSLNGRGETMLFNFHVFVVESIDNVNYRHPIVTMVHPIEPFGYHKYLNIGRKAGTSDYVCLCNNDLVFESGWATAMVTQMESDNLYSACPLDPSYHPKREIHANTGNISGYRIGGEMAGWCIFQKRAIYDLIGDLDEDFTFWYADNDYARTLKSYGIEHKLITSSLVTHLGSQTLLQLDPLEQGDMCQSQLATYQNKWGEMNPWIEYLM